jgi:zinc transport system substrate-binding protein
MTMKKYILLLPLSLLMGIAACNAPEKQNRPLVVTSIPPLGDWIAAVGGSDVDVLVLVPPSSNPHTFELSPGQLRKASQASLVVLNGAGLEFWSDRLLDNLQDAETPVLSLSDGLELLQAGDCHDHGHDHGHDHSDGHNHGAAGNPHFWLDPVIAVASVQRIAAALTALLPARADSIRVRSESYVARLRELDSEFATAAAGWTRRRFVSDHAAWVYFAARYGLDEAGVIEEVPGREISAREMSGLIRDMRDKDIMVVFADMRKSSRPADILAEETGARIAQLDLLCSGGRSYLEMMRDNLAKMAQVMK